MARSVGGAVKLALAEKQTVKVEHAKCRVFMHRLEGHVFLETVNGRSRWVARLQCVRCGRSRVDVMTVGTCELISRKYFGGDGYDTTWDRSDAKKFLFKVMLDESED